MRGGCASTSTQSIVALLHPHFAPTLMTLHGAQHCTKILTAIQIENWLLCQVSSTENMDEEQMMDYLDLDIMLCCS